MFSPTSPGTCLVESRRVRVLLATTLAVLTTGCTGSIEDNGEVTPPENPPRAVDIDGPPVLAHVQEFANALCGATDACTISTYSGHHPTAARALDILVSDVYGKRPTDNNALGDEVA